MMMVYYVTVEFGGNLKNPNWLHVSKVIKKCRVTKTGHRYLHLCPMPEGYHSESFQVPIEDCFSSPEDAQVEANKRANVLITRLEGYIEKLKQPAEVYDRLS